MSYKLSAQSLRAVVLAETQFQPVFKWEGGKRTSEQLTDEKNRPIFRATQVPAVFQGQSDVVSLVTFRETTLPAGSVIGVDGKGEAFAEVRGISEEGSRFVEQRLTVTAENFVVLHDISEVLK